MAIDYSLFRFGKGKPLELTKHSKKTADDAALRAAYVLVDRRDKGICRVTGTKTEPHAAAQKMRREHHHLRGRTVRPDLVNEPSNIVTVTAFVHKLLTKNALEVEGADANQKLLFHWNRAIVAPSKEPFKLNRAGKRNAVRRSSQEPRVETSMGEGSAR